MPSGKTWEPKLCACRKPHGVQAVGALGRLPFLRLSARRGRHSQLVDKASTLAQVEDCCTLHIRHPLQRGASVLSPKYNDNEAASLFAGGPASSSPDVTVSS